MANSVSASTSSCRARHLAPRTFILALVLVLSACATASATASTPTPSPTVASGDLGVFLAAEVYAPATPGQTTGTPAGFKLTALRAGDGAVAWSKTLSQGYYGPIVADGMLYGVLVPLQSNGTAPQTTLTAQRTSDGTQVWQAPSSNPSLPVAAANGAVYAVIYSSQGTQLGKLMVLRASDGGQLWTADLGGILYGATNQPILAANGTLYCVVNSAPQSGGSAPQLEAVALKASDGTPQWSASLTPSINAQISALVVSGSTLYIAGQFSPPTSSNIPEVPTVVALRVSDGSMLWTRQFTSPLPTGQLSLVAGDSGVYAAVALQPQGASSLPGGMLVGLNPQTGAQTWSTTLGGFATSLIAGSGALYVGTGFSYGEPNPPPNTVSTYNQTDGKPVWTQTLPNGTPTLLASANGSIYGSVAAPVTQTSTGPGATFIEAFKTSDGSLQWKYEVDGLSRATVAPF